MKDEAKLKSMHYTSHGSIRPRGASLFGWLEVLDLTISLQSSKWFHYQSVERLTDFQKHQCINPTSKHRDGSGTRYEQRVGDSSVMIWSDVSLVNVSCRILPHKLKNNFATIVCKASTRILHNNLFMTNQLNFRFLDEFM